MVLLLLLILLLLTMVLLVVVMVSKELSMAGVIIRVIGVARVEVGLTSLI